MMPLMPLMLVAAAGAWWCACANAQTPAAEPRFPITPEQRSVADKVSQAGLPLSELAPNAPESHTVKSGDTLWGISTLFLKSPWRWPELWGMNRSEIKNPHLIYPGQVLVLVRTPEGRVQLKLAQGGTPAPQAAAAAPAPAPAVPAAPPEPTIRLSPRVRDLGSVSAAAIPSIPNNLIEPFLSQPLVVSADDLQRYARVVATPEDRVFLGRGDLAYARGINSDRIDDFHVFRPAAALYDPDDYDRKKPIAYEAYYLGTARVIKRGEVSTVRIQDSKEEIGVADRLVPIEHQALINYVPHQPEASIDGRIISVYGGVDTAGAESIVTLNRGSRDGLEIGHVLAVLRTGATVRDRTAPSREFVKLPDEGIGHMFVFRVFDGISYALVLTASGPIKVGDRFSQPDAAAAAAMSGRADAASLAHAGE
jgi:LysM repeat protein